MVHAPFYDAVCRRLLAEEDELWWGAPVDDSQYGPRNQSDTRECEQP